MLVHGLFWHIFGDETQYLIGIIRDYFPLAGTVLYKTLSMNEVSKRTGISKLRKTKRTTLILDAPVPTFDFIVLTS